MDDKKLKLILFANQIVTQLLLALSDGVVTSEECVGMIQAFFDQFGFDVKLGGTKIFIEADGDLHVIIPKHILDKLKIKI